MGKFTREVFKTEKAWLNARKKSITGTFAGAIIGVNPYMTNEQAYKRIQGLEQAEDLRGNDFVRYGKMAERHLAELFRLDFPQYDVEMHDYWILKNKEFPHFKYSPDGLISVKTTEETPTHGILEIKTVNGKKWQDNTIPESYYAQVLWGLLVTGYDFVILKAQFKFDFDDMPYCQTQHYRINREEVLEDIEILKKEAIDFWSNNILKGVCPPLKIQI